MEEIKDFALMLDMLKKTNAGYFAVGIDGYQFIVCTEEAFKVMNKAYYEWIDKEEGDKHE